MEIKIFPALPDNLAEKFNQFILKNFYARKEKIQENLAGEEEKYFSQPKAWLLIFEGDQIISGILLHQRKIKFNNKDVILGGIGKVCTRKDKRRKRIASLMLTEAVKILKEWGCDIAYLCANIEKTGSLYRRAGFVPLNKPYSYYGRSGKLYEERNGMIAPLNSPSLFEEILNSKKKLHLGLGNW